MRGQVELPALAIALLVLTLTLFLGLSVATTVLSGADRDATERQAAVGLSDQLVAEEADITTRQNVLISSTIESLNQTVLRDRYGLGDDATVSIRLGGEQLLNPGGSFGGTTVERLVLLESRTGEMVTPDFEDSRVATLPRRSANVTIALAPPAPTTVESVRANGRTILRNESGLRGRFEISVSRLQTTDLWFEAAGPLPTGSVELHYETPETRKATLAVTVDG